MNLKTPVIENKFPTAKNRISTFIFNNIDILFFLIIVSTKLLLFSKHIATYFSFTESLPNIVASVMVLVSIPIIFKNKNRTRLFYIFNIVISILIISDLVYYRYFKDIISIGVIRNGLLLGGVKSSVQALINLSDFLYLLDVFILIPFLKMYKKRERNQIVFSRRIALFLITFIFGLGFNIHFIIKLGNAQPRLLTTMYNRLYVSQALGDINFHVLDIYNFVSNVIKKSSKLSDNRTNEIKSTLNQSSVQINNKFNGVGVNKNLITIQVEALQQFVINSKINNEEITPNLNRWLKKSRYYDNYFYQISSGNTSDAEFMTNNSLYPASSGAAYYIYSGNYFNSLPKLLKNKGYTTAAFHGYKESFWNRNIMYKSEHFDTFNGETSYKLDDIVGMGISDKSFLNQTLDKIKKLKQPYYAFIITLSSHFPFNDTKRYGDFNVGEYEGTLLGDYLKSIHYTDAQLGMFLDKLEQEGISQNSIITLYGDHYAMPKNQANQLLKFTNAPNNNDLSWFQHQKVPLLVHFPNDANSGVDHTYSGQMDILPGIATLFNLPKDYMLGKDIFNPTTQDVMFRNGSFTDGKYFYISWSDTYYDIATGNEVKETPALKKKKQQALEKLSISDDILDHNLIKKFDSK